MNANESKEIVRDDQESKLEESEVDSDHTTKGVLANDVPAAAAWTNHITVRATVASVLIGLVFSVIAMKLNLTTGVTPHLNVSAALLAFIFIRTWTKLLHKMGFSTLPFTPQENTMIQTCVVACYAIAIGGGFGSYLLGMNTKTFEQSGGASVVGNTLSSIKEPGIGWMTAYLFLVCFIGLLVLIPLRRVLIIDYRLTFPTGMATAVLINGFHSSGDKTAKRLVSGFMKSSSLSFVWGFFQWFYSGKGSQCGFSQFPTFGLQAQRQTFYFDFSLTYVGTGMICSHIVNLSLLLGAVLSYGMMWPLLSKLKGQWFPADVPEESMRSLNGYKVFISIAILLGDGLYNFVKIVGVTVSNFHVKLKERQRRSGAYEANEEERMNGSVLTSSIKQDEMFTRETIPLWLAAAAYALVAAVCVVAIPFVFPQLKWYYVIIAYLFAPSLAFCNAYGAGLTDINMAYNYGKVGLFTIAALAGRQHGVIAGMAACGLCKSVINVSCVLMQDFKTAHLTLTSPRSMLISQGVGTALGCVVSPLTFLLFYKAFDIGNPDGEFKAPYAIIYRNLAIIGVQGFSALPQHCLELCYGFFALAVFVNLVKDVLPEKIGRWMPLPTAMAVPFLIGGYFAIDMCLGSLVVFVWEKLDSKRAEMMVPAVASGLICGEGIWILPASILSLAKVTPPICMKFLPTS